MSIAREIFENPGMHSASISTPVAMPTGWLCPKCQGAHGPHVDSCPVVYGEESPTTIRNFVRAGLANIQDYGAT